MTATGLKQFTGCGRHGLVENSRKKKWDPWCGRCNPMPAARGFTETPGQRYARRKGGGERAL